VRDTNGVIEQIAESTAMQSRATEEIARHVELIARMTSEESAVIAQTLEAATELDNLSVDLRQSAAKFKV
jgi:methyl-accepting chemotaxis protein